MKEERFINADGLRIFFRSWTPASPPRGIIVINHGVNSHGGQYLWAAERFVEAGFSIYAIDMRGRGRSEGPRYRISDIAEYTGDLDHLIKLAKKREPGLPLYLLGHSAGGVVACSYALDRQAELDGLICESFAFKVPAPDFVLGFIKLLSRLLPGLPVLKLKNEDFSRDPRAVKALNSDPLTKGEIQPASTVAALVRADERMEREFPTITLPLFILHGTADKATLFSGSQLFMRTAGSEDKTLRLYEGHYHDLLNDFGKESVLSDVISWIDERIESRKGSRPVAVLSQAAQ